MEIFRTLGSGSLLVTAMLDFSGKANTSIHGLGEDDTASKYHGYIPANTRHIFNVGSTLGQCLLCWPNIDQTSVQRLMFAGQSDVWADVRIHWSASIHQLWLDQKTQKKHSYTAFNSCVIKRLYHHNQRKSFRHILWHNMDNYHVKVERSELDIKSAYMFYIPTYESYIYRPYA